MARITVEDCLKQVDNRFALIHLAAKRVRQLRKGAEPLVVCKNKDIVVSLREIAAGDIVQLKESDRPSTARLLEGLNEIALTLDTPEAPASEAASQAESAQEATPASADSGASEPVDLEAETPEAQVPTEGTEPVSSSEPQIALPASDADSEKTPSQPPAEHAAQEPVPVETPAAEAEPALPPDDSPSTEPTGPGPEPPVETEASDIPASHEPSLGETGLPADAEVSEPAPDAEPRPQAGAESAAAPASQADRTDNTTAAADSGSQPENAPGDGSGSKTPPPAASNEPEAGKTAESLEPAPHESAAQDLQAPDPQSPSAQEAAAVRPDPASETDQGPDDAFQRPSVSQDEGSST